MDDHVAEVHDQPAVVRLAFGAAFLFVRAFHRFQHRLGERVQHTSAGACADDEIIGKRRDFLDIDQQDVFALFVFQGINNGAGKFESVQKVTSLGWLYRKINFASDWRAK